MLNYFTAFIIKKVKYFRKMNKIKKIVSNEEEEKNKNNEN